MAHTVVDVTGTVNQVSFPEVDALYLWPATQGAPGAGQAELIPATSGVPRLKGNRDITDVNLDDGAVLKLVGKNRDFGDYTIPLYAAANNAKVLQIEAADEGGTLMKGNAFYRDGSGYSFLTYIAGFGPAGDEADFHYEFGVAPFQVTRIPKP